SGMTTQPSSRFASPCYSAQRAYRFARSASAREFRRSRSERRAGASPHDSASSSITLGRMRQGLLATGAVSSSARSHALAAEVLGGIAGIHREDGSRDALRTVAEKKFDGAGHVVDVGKATQGAAPLDLLPLLGVEPP